METRRTRHRHSECRYHHSDYNISVFQTPEPPNPHPYSIPTFSVLIISTYRGTISTVPNLFQGGSTMPNHVSNETLLFTKCINLNTDQCRYTKNPEKILSIFKDPANFAIDNQNVQELNDICSQCDSYQMS